MRPDGIDEAEQDVDGEPVKWYVSLSLSLSLSLSVSLSLSLSLSLSVPF